MRGSTPVNAVFSGNSLLWVGPADISEWLTRITAAGGQAPSSTVQDACKMLLGRLKAYNLYPKILRLNLFCGGDWIGSMVPLIVTQGIGQSYDYNGKYAPGNASGPFVASDWTLANGFNASGNNALQVSGNVTGNTNATSNKIRIIDSTIPQSALSGYSAHFAAYITGASPNSSITQHTDMGVIGSGAQNFVLQAAYGGNTSTSSRFNCYAQDSTAAGGTLTTYLTTPTGFFVGSRVSTWASGGAPTAPTTSSNAIYRNASLISYRVGSNPNTTYGTPNLDTSTITVFGRGSVGTYASSSRVVGNATDRSMSMYSIGYGLTATDVSNYQSILALFNTAIGRTNY